jgi:hypothetical protein
MMITRPSWNASPALSTGEGEAAFDLWLRTGLRREYQNVLAAPVPQDLLDLIAKAGRREKPETAK